MQKKEYLEHLQAEIDALKEKKRNLTIRFATELAALDEELNQKVEAFYRHLHDVVYSAHPGAEREGERARAEYPASDDAHLTTRFRARAIEKEPVTFSAPKPPPVYQRPYFNVEKDIVPKVESFLKQVGRPATKNEIVEYLKQHHNIAYKNPFIILKKCEQLSAHVEKIGRALYKYSEQKEHYSKPDKTIKTSTFKTDVLPLILAIMREKNQPVTGKEIFQTLEQKHQLVYLNYTLTMNRVMSLEPRVRKLDRDLYVLEEEEPVEVSHSAANPGASTERAGQDQEEK